MTLGGFKKSGISGLCQPSKKERLYLNFLKSIPDYPFNFAKDLSFLRDLIVDFPTIELIEDLKKWKTWLLDKNLKGKVNYRSRLRKWLLNSRKFKEEKKDEIHRQNSGKDRKENFVPFSNIPPELRY